MAVGPRAPVSVEESARGGAARNCASYSGVCVLCDASE